MNQDMRVLIFFGLACVISLGAWAQSDTLAIGDSTSVLALRKLKVAVHISPPFIAKNAQGNYEGISIELWERIAVDLNIEFEYQEASIPEILQGLKNRQFDMAINPLTVTSERMQEVAFSHPFYASNSTIAIRKSSRWQRIVSFIASFFSLNFLSAIGFLFLVILFFGFLLWLFERRANRDEFGEGLTGLGNGIWWSAVTMTTVGYGDKSPKSLGGRIVAVIWMFTAIIIISGFTASIASSLTVNEIGGNTDDIEDFKKRVIASVDGSASANYLKKNFFRKLKEYDEIQNGLAALDKGEVEGFVYDEPILRYVIDRDSLDKLEVLPLKFDLQFYAFAFSKEDTSLRDLISQSILAFTEDTQWKVLLSDYNLSEI